MKSSQTSVAKMFADNFLSVRSSCYQFENLNYWIFYKISYFFEFSQILKSDGYQNKVNMSFSSSHQQNLKQREMLPILEDETLVLCGEKTEQQKSTSDSKPSKSMCFISL